MQYNTIQIKTIIIYRNKVLIYSYILLNLPQFGSIPNFANDGFCSKSGSISTRSPVVSTIAATIATVSAVPAAWRSQRSPKFNHPSKVGFLGNVERSGTWMDLGESFKGGLAKFKQSQEDPTCLSLAAENSMTDRNLDELRAKLLQDSLFVTFENDKPKACGRRARRPKSSDSPLETVRVLEDLHISRTCVQSVLRSAMA